MSVARFERFFRSAASLDVDKDDLKRHNDFINAKLADLLIMAQATAKANARDIIEPWDLPITKGLQECIHEFDRLDEAIELEPILEHLASAPMLDLECSDETEAELPRIVGGIDVALAHAFKLIDTRLKNPHGEQWERVFQVFNLLL
jgi:hypothetical protein